MLFRFCLYGFLKNQRYFEPFLMLVFLDRGLSFFAIGLLIACRDHAVNLLEIPSGAAADAFGRRRAMMLSFVAYIASFLVLATTSNLTWLFAGMFLFGVGDTLRTGTHKAMIFEWLRINGRSDERTKIYGLTRSWSQIGSAVSGVIAAIFILISGSYQYVFYFAIAPYALNLINFAGYPSALDGEHEKAASVKETAIRLKNSLSHAIRIPALRRLMLESMGWGGFFAATKDYLQPVLQSAAVIGIAFLLGQNDSVSSPESPWLNDPRKSALLIGPVYALLFLASAVASRNAHHFVNRTGSESNASTQLWLISSVLYISIGIAGGFNWIPVLIVAFVCLHILRNLWRPILISRFDAHSEAKEGATILSIESQSRRIATLVFAPAIGWAIDSVRQQGWGGEYWPIGLVGGLIAIGMYGTSSGLTSPANRSDR